MICDPTDVAFHGEGLCATARDVARFGQILVDRGSAPLGDAEGNWCSVVAERWLRDAWAVDADIRSVFAASPNENAMRGGWYRDQFWIRPGASGHVLLCLGIHGQMVHVSPRTRSVCVKLSTWPNAQNLSYLQDILRLSTTSVVRSAGALEARCAVLHRESCPVGREQYSLSFLGTYLPDCLVAVVKTG